MRSPTADMIYVPKDAPLNPILDFCEENEQFPGECTNPRATSRGSLGPKPPHKQPNLEPLQLIDGEMLRRPKHVPHPIAMYNEPWLRDINKVDPELMKRIDTILANDKKGLSAFIQTMAGQPPENVIAGFYNMVGLGDFYEAHKEPAGVRLMREESARANKKQTDKVKTSAHNSQSAGGVDTSGPGYGTSQSFGSGASAYRSTRSY